MDNTLGPDLQTGGAAGFATQLGRPTSPSYLQKRRLRGPDDPGDPGPDFYRDKYGRCWYPRAAVISWVDQWRSGRRFREPGSVPTHFSAPSTCKAAA